MFLLVPREDPLDGSVIGRERGRAVRDHQRDQVLRQQMLADELERAIECARRLLNPAQMGNDDERAPGRRRQAAFRRPRDCHRRIHRRPRRQHLRVKDRDLARHAVLENPEVRLREARDRPSLLVRHRHGDRHQRGAAAKYRPLFLREQDQAGQGQRRQAP